MNGARHEHGESTEARERMREALLVRLASHHRRRRAWRVAAATCAAGLATAAILIPSRTARPGPELRESAPSHSMVTVITNAPGIAERLASTGPAAARVEVIDDGRLLTLAQDAANADLTLVRDALGTRLVARSGF